MTTEPPTGGRKVIVRHETGEKGPQRCMGTLDMGNKQRPCAVVQGPVYVVSMQGTKCSVCLCGQRACRASCGPVAGEDLPPASLTWPSLPGRPPGPAQVSTGKPYLCTRGRQVNMSPDMATCTFPMGYGGGGGGVVGRGGQGLFHAWMCGLELYNESILNGIRNTLTILTGR